ncbi:lactaldehyde dehydrogenase/glycolaldehyde dehydrogenase [Pseudomonas citronellolis]|uniref:aldehyde dehydrogenase n=1 Tax=Pseudomonas citronellolis TaxID=53408 RepID=UPI0020A16723|nr:aldehyde dehydrogenase [Pseudomonas citronellolis]MCP1642119.1 lactaldehyde dehydrogenase/glycolaldehyde dehydrogenase [Pseudomonas citronellolis]MCP1668535.1 lactaldehyde dehydrogenase/glycolaldehyde dehydrogenase [Pseudomonas citronellolis]MCP1698009.1 lactaldehyde dehydrogenase/glycolaldehyde dehydrogenase [Pseudomonas citronellolis]MCP1704746.1 lactaldehyde dehydrogenase/glycolaldehyde dehydrogenase [Pseudomonas citronellolis]MCP1799066.1 lactaldehyde dehydrogenase/glycolaldehyde dehydr
MRTDQNFIDGRFRDCSVAARIAVSDPATEACIAEVPAASEAEVRQAVEAAQRAQRDWAKLPAIERGEYLRRFAEAIKRNAARIGEALARESGKSLQDATNEAVYAAQITRYHAEWARRIEGEVIPSDSRDETILLQREPIGVVACLIPFNYPVYTLLRKVAPALITGNTVVVRPSNNTPTSAFEIARAAAEAELPAGVFNVLTMVHEVAATLCQHPAVGMITLTGSVGAGRTVLDYCKANIAKPSLELGGKTPAIIEADADLEQAASAIAASKTTHCGQLCTAIERVYVQASVHDRFLALLRDKLAAVRSGDRSEDPSRMGPLVNERSRQEIHAKVQRALAEGAQLECGGMLPEGPGHFYPATLLSNCRQDMEIVQEEIFGPVLPVLRYETLDEALAMANDHQFGLSSVLYSENYRTAMKVANAIEAGELYVNRTPADPYQGFHAGWKRSGLGGDDGKHGMLEFTQTRLVVLKY